MKRHRVEIHDADPPDAACAERVRKAASKPARADDQDALVRKRALRLLAPKLDLSVKVVHKSPLLTRFLRNFHSPRAAAISSASTSHISTPSSFFSSFAISPIGVTTKLSP